MPQSELTYQTWGPLSNSWWVVGAGGILHIKHLHITPNTIKRDSVVSLHKQIKVSTKYHIKHQTPLNTIKIFSPAIYLYGKIPPPTEFPYWACLLGLL